VVDRQPTDDDAVGVGCDVGHTIQYLKGALPNGALGDDDVAGVGCDVGHTIRYLEGALTDGATKAFFFLLS
jgi:hypothetical protein